MRQGVCNRCGFNLFFEQTDGERLSIAATHSGFKAQITLLPDEEPGGFLNSKSIARLKLLKDTEITPDPLFLYTLQRRTNRKPHDMEKSVEQGKFQKITNVVNNDVIAGGVVMG